MKFHLKALAAVAILAALAACGGSSSDDEVVPTGGDLSNVWFADSDSYFPLDKLNSDGTFLTGTESDYGTVNPAYTTGSTTVSRWAIDTSATVEGDDALEYSMSISAISATNAAILSLQSNLSLDTSTGLITQTCSGFPVCYENTTGTEEAFRVSVTAKVSGGDGELNRSFVLRVR